jgi:hypothetical protein
MGTEPRDINIGRDIVLGRVNAVGYWDNITFDDLCVNRGIGTIR